MGVHFQHLSQCNMNKDEILNFSRDCFSNYLDDIRKRVPALPDPYLYPDGNPIRPVIPTQTAQNSLMLIGAFPSARFEKRKGLLIPVGDNLSPFGYEEYFDGHDVRTQASRDRLDELYFPTLGVNPKQMWITDIVKIYLYPEKHIKNCKEIAPDINYVNTHTLFSRIAKESMAWIEKEIMVCNPKLIITLGEVPARTISKDKKTPTLLLLNGSVRTFSLKGSDYAIAHLAHPEICRINSTWHKDTIKALRILAGSVSKILSQA